MARRDEVDELGPDALTAADEGARMLAEGRYAQVAGDRPGMVERAAGFVAARRRWEPHLRGWGCRRCGPTVHSRRAAHRHDWWHRWLEAMFGAIGEDVDKLEGELEMLRAELAEAEAASAAAVEQVGVITAALGPTLARTLEAQDRPRWAEPPDRVSEWRRGVEDGADPRTL